MPFGPRWRRLGRVLTGFVAVYLVVAIYQSSLKPLPEGLSTSGKTHRVTAHEVEFLQDTTYMRDGERTSEQVIFDRAIELIHGAEDFILADLFLFNDYLGKAREVHRRLSAEVVDALLERKRSRPNIRIVVITDPVNEAYGGSELALFAQLRAAEIPVVFTNLAALRDSNVGYSPFWRMFVQWFGVSRGGSLPHPFSQDADGIGVRSWLTLLNFKANHRKLLVVDAAAKPGDAAAREMVALLMSANPHDGSSAHSNIALQVRGGTLWRDVIASEQAILRVSAPELELESWLPAYVRMDTDSVTPLTASDDTGDASVRLITEGKICTALLEAIDATEAGDSIDVAMFYLAERRIITALLRAAKRGVTVRVLLDPNRDAFGYEKDGVPNRPVATELVQRSEGRIAVRWFDTHGEQFHTKMVLVRRGDHAVLFAGSANLTRRNIGDFNLESDLMLAGTATFTALQNAGEYFERLWSNDGAQFTVPFETYQDDSLLRGWRYRLQEQFGAGTF